MQLSRRNYLKTALAAAGAWALPSFSIVRAQATRKLNVAAVGCAGMAGGAGVHAAAQENLVAMCDVDQAVAAETFARRPNVPKFSDFRRMLDKMHRDIDVVMISTPDHTHFPIAMACMERGKHVFVQKPLAHNIWQVRTMARAARYYKVRTNMGNQGRTLDGMRVIKEWSDSGLIGQIVEVHAWTSKLGRNILPAVNPPLPPREVPKTLAWDLWLGPTAARPFHEEYLSFKWRSWWDFGTGALGDIGCHSLEAPFWALGCPRPERAEFVNSEGGSAELAPRKTHLVYHFPGEKGRQPIKFNWYDGGSVPKDLLETYNSRLQPRKGDQAETAGSRINTGDGVIIVGTRHTVYHGGIRPNAPQLVMPADEWYEFRHSTALPPKTIPRVDCHPATELVRVVKGELPEAGSHFGYAAQLSEIVLVGALAVRSRTTVAWDGDRMEVRGRPDLNPWIKEPVRKGWEYGESL